NGGASRPAVRRAGMALTTAGRLRAPPSRRSRGGGTLVGPLLPPSGGVATHVADLRALLPTPGVPCRVLLPGPEPPFFGELALGATSDVVHAHIHGHSVQAWMLASLCSAAPRSVLTIHSGLAHLYVPEHARLVRAAVSRYAAIVCVSAAISNVM